jgi:NitT/TauT family transport system permease protein
MSKEQKEFLKKYKLNKLIILFIQIMIIIVFFGTWEYLSKNNIINSFIFSSPSKVIDTIYRLYLDNNLFNHI